MNFIYFNLDLSLVAYLKAFAFNKKRERSVLRGKCKIIFLSFLEISQHLHQDLNMSSSSNKPKSCGIPPSK